MQVPPQQPTARMPKFILPVIHSLLNWSTLSFLNSIVTAAPIATTIPPPQSRWHLPSLQLLTFQHSRLCRSDPIRHQYRKLSLRTTGNRYYSKCVPYHSTIGNPSYSNTHYSCGRWNLNGSETKYNRIHDTRFCLL